MGVEQGVNQADEPLHILVIDADIPEADMLSDILTPDGFEVEICRDVDTARQVFKVRRVDVVIEGKGSPITRFNDAKLSIAYQLRVNDMTEAERAILMARGILPVGQDPVLLEESVNRYGFLRRIKDSANQALSNATR